MLYFLDYQQLQGLFGSVEILAKKRKTKGSLSSALFNIKFIFTVGNFNGNRIHLRKFD